METLKKKIEVIQTEDFTIQGKLAEICIIERYSTGKLEAWPHFQALMRLVLAHTDKIGQCVRK